MAPHPKLTTTSVINQALSIIQRNGYDALSVSAVAKQMSVAPSALYTYCNDLDGLRNLVATTAMKNLTTFVRNAATGASGETALKAMGNAYHDFALEYPGQFASTLRPPPVDNSDFDEATKSLHEVFVRVYSAMDLTPDQANLAAKTTRSAIHGFLTLEHITGNKPHHAEEYEHLIQVLMIGHKSHPTM